MRIRFGASSALAAAVARVKHESASHAAAIVFTAARSCREPVNRADDFIVMSSADQTTRIFDRASLKCWNSMPARLYPEAFVSPGAGARQGNGCRDYRSLRAAYRFHNWDLLRIALEFGAHRF